MRNLVAGALLFAVLAAPAYAQSWEVIQSRQQQMLITQQQNMLQQQRDEAYRQEQQRQVDRFRCIMAQSPASC